MSEMHMTVGFYNLLSIQTQSFTPTRFYSVISHFTES